MMDGIAFQTLISRSVANVERGSHLVGGAG